MKILHINCTDDGSTGKIIQDISACAASRGHENYLCTPQITHENPSIKKIKTSVQHEQGLYLRIAKLLGFQYGFAPVSTSRILRTIQQVKPDVVHLHSINCNIVNIYKLLGFLKKNHIPTVVTNHAEFFYTGSCAYSYFCENWKTGCGNCESYKTSCASVWDSSHLAWRKMKKAFSGFQEARVVSVSPFTYSRSKQSPIMEGIEQRVVLNGIDTEIFRPYPAQENDGMQGEKLVAYVTAFFDPLEDDRKGSAHVVELARRFSGENVRFLVIGKSTSKKVDLPANMTIVGFVADQKQLAQYYSMADVSLITSKRETFSMPVAESLACGTPLVGFLAGGPESIAIKDFCSFVDFGDVDALEELLRNGWLTKKEELGVQTIAAEAEKVYAGNIMAQKYLDIYQELLTP